MTHEGFTVEQRMLGRISCWGALIVGLAYTVFAILTRVNNPTTAAASFSDPFLPIASILLVPVAALMIASMAAVHAYAPPRLRVYSLLALLFMGLGMGITTIINFAVFFIVTHPSEMANAPWLSLILPFKRPGMFGELDLLAWSWFFGLSMIVAAPVFREGRLERILRILMLATGILPIVGWVMMIFFPSADLPAWILQALGWGVLILIVWFLLARVFDRAHPAERQST
jgi:hypothetical protein